MSFGECEFGADIATYIFFLMLMLMLIFVNFRIKQCADKLPEDRKFDLIAYGICRSPFFAVLTGIICFDISDRSTVFNGYRVRRRYVVCTPCSLSGTKQNLL